MGKLRYVRNNSIDLLKFICAVLVVFLHSHWKFQDLFLPLTRCALPCFLIISGYLLYNEGEIGKERLKRNIRNIFKITFHTTLLYIVWSEFISFVSKGVLFSFDLNNIVDWLIFNDCPFGFHLWYLYAYLYVLLIYGLFEMKGKANILLCLTPFLLLLDVLLGKYGMLLWHIDVPVVYLRNFLFVGIPYFCLGIILKKFKYLMPTNRFLLSGGVIFFIGTSYFERWIVTALGIQSSRDHYVSSTFLAVCIFLLVTSFTIKRECLFIKLGNRDSLYIYILHPLILASLAVVVNRIGWSDIYSYVVPFVCFTVTMILISFLNKIKIVK